MNSSLMKAAFLEGPGKISVKETPKPELDDHKLIVKVEYCGICTLEQRLYKGDMKIFYPIIPGHEAAGRVVEIGSKAGNEFEIGDKVALDMVFRCNVCHYCRSGQSNLCEHRFNRSTTPLGGFSEYVLVRPSQVHKLDKDIDIKVGAFTEPAACCIHSLKKINLTLAEDFLVVGAGPMGLLHLQVALNMGARVFVTDVNNERLKLAEQLGACKVFNPAECVIKDQIHSLTGGRGVDACVVTSPAHPALNDAFSSVRKGGRINIYTAYMEEIPQLPIDLNTLHRSEILVTGTEGRTPEDFQQAARLLSFGKINVEPLISRIVSLNNLSEGIELAMSSDTQRVLLGMN